MRVSAGRAYKARLRVSAGRAYKARLQLSAGEWGARLQSTPAVECG